jgi:hypothetical protein
MIAMAIGCSEESGGGAGSGGDPGQVERETILFDVVDEESEPLEAARVCEVGADNCATTDVDGKTTLDFPKDEEVAWSVEKEGYLVLAGADVTDETLDPGPFTWRLRTVETMDAWAEQLGTTSPLTATYNRAVPPRIGATYTLVDETALGYYMDMGMPDPELAATTSEGDGGFAEVSPGVVEVEFGGTATDCVASLAWPSERPNTIRLPVIEGVTTYGSMRCGSE